MQLDRYVLEFLNRLPEQNMVFSFIIGFCPRANLGFVCFKELRVRRAVFPFWLYSDLSMGHKA